MTAIELVNQIRELYLRSNIDLNALRDETLVDEEVDTTKLVAPFTVYDVGYDYDSDENIVGGHVVPLRVIRYGILPGCSAPSITVMRTPFHRLNVVEPYAQWNSTLDMYYFSKERAQAELDYQLQVSHNRQAQMQLAKLLDQYLCVLINSIDVSVLDSQLHSLTALN